MARSKQSKQDALSRLSTALESAVSVVFTSVKGLKVHEFEELRRTLRTEGNECVVAKKTILSRVFSSTEQSPNFKDMEGEVAAVFGYRDQVSPARILYSFGKTHEKLTILAGLLKDESSGIQLLTASAMTALALLPSRDELRAKAVGSLAAPLRNCVGILHAPLRAFVQTLHAFAQTKL